jgi:hypothetical protein
MKAIHVELAVASYFGIRRHLIVPNVSWGLGLRHECDLLIVRESGFAAEVEIKVSKSDLKKDVEKRKWAMAERYGYSKKDEFEMSEPETKQPEQRVISTPLFT